jgi:hypothetical protein
MRERSCGTVSESLSAPIDETQIQYIAALSHCLDAVLSLVVKWHEEANKISYLE